MNKSYKLLIILSTMLIVVSIMNYYRTFVLKDYFVTLEVPCRDEGNCFFGLDENGEEYTFNIIKLKAYNLFSQCGKDVSECEVKCLEDDEECTLSDCSNNLNNNEMCKRQ